MMIAEWVYILCGLSSVACAATLIRQYRKDRTRLLLFSCFAFVGLAMNNIVLVVDLVMMPGADIYGSLWRNSIGATSGGLLLYGLIWELT